MNIRRALNLALTAAALAALAGQPVFASKLLLPSTISGTVTSSAVGGAISINGHSYQIDPKSQAATEAPNLLAGQSVEVKLSGPANSKASQVVEIHASESH
jgi:hypothetical protein